MFLEGNRDDTSIQCFPKTVAQNSKMDARAIIPLQLVDAAGDNGNVAQEQAGGGKDGCTGRVQAPVAPGSTSPAAGEMPSSEEVERMKS